MSATGPLPGGGPARTGHDIVAVGAFELIGVSLLAILADSNENIGNIIVVFMVGFLVIWFIAYGYKLLGRVNQSVKTMTG